MQPASLFAFTAWLFLQLLHDPHYANLPAMTVKSEEEGEDSLAAIVGTFLGPMQDSNTMFTVGLNNYRICTMFTMFDADLGFWVRPPSTTWFSRFLLEQYDDHC